MQKIQDTISKNLKEHLDKADKLSTLQIGLEWFLSFYGNTIFEHQDIRGGNVTPVIILSTKGTNLVDQNILQQSFEKQECYDKFKKHQLTVGYALHDEKTYFYIGCNDTLDYSNEEAKDLLYRRVNKELFPHIEKYFN